MTKIRKKHKSMMKSDGEFSVSMDAIIGPNIQYWQRTEL